MLAHFHRLGAILHLLERLVVSSCLAASCVRARGALRTRVNGVDEERKRKETSALLPPRDQLECVQPNPIPAPHQQMLSRVIRLPRCITQKDSCVSCSCFEIYETLKSRNNQTLFFISFVVSLLKFMINVEFSKIERLVSIVSSFVVKQSYKQ